MKKIHHLAIQHKQQKTLGFLHSNKPNKILVSALSKEQAAVLINNISTSSFNVFKNVVKLIKYRGHLALHFSKPQECLRKKVPELSNSYICRLLKATDTYLKLDSDLLYLERVSESTFRPLHNIADDDAKRVWANVLQNNKADRISAKHIKHAMITLGLVIELKSKLPVLKVDTALQRDVTLYVQHISKKFLTPHVKSSREWGQLANFIYQQLLKNCHYPEASAKRGVIQ